MMREIIIIYLHFTLIKILKISTLHKLTILKILFYQNHNMEQANND